MSTFTLTGKSKLVDNQRLFQIAHGTITTTTVRDTGALTATGLANKHFTVNDSNEEVGIWFNRGGGAHAVDASVNRWIEVDIINAQNIQDVFEATVLKLSLDTDLIAEVIESTLHIKLRTPAAVSASADVSTGFIIGNPALVGGWIQNGASYTIIVDNGFDPADLDGTYFKTFDADETVGVWFDYDTGVEPTDVSVDRWIKVDITAMTTSADVIDELISTIDNDADFVAYKANGNCYFGLGAVADVAATVDEDTNFNIINVRANLAQTGTCFVYDNAIVMQNAEVSGSAIVKDTAIVSGTATIAGSAVIKNRALVSGSVNVDGNAVVQDDVVVSGTADLGDDVKTYGSAVIQGAATLADDAVVSGSALIDGTVALAGYAKVGGDAHISGATSLNATLAGDINIKTGYISAGTITTLVLA